jgi:hypothetical protein
MKNGKTNIVKDDKADSFRVIWGGYWGSYPTDLRSERRYDGSPANRFRLFASDRVDYAGFRLVLQKKKKEKKK